MIHRRQCLHQRLRNWHLSPPQTTRPYHWLLQHAHGPQQTDQKPNKLPRPVCLLQQCSRHAILQQPSKKPLIVLEPCPPHIMRSHRQQFPIYVPWPHCKANQETPTQPTRGAQRTHENVLTRHPKHQEQPNTKDICYDSTQSTTGRCLSLVSFCTLEAPKPTSKVATNQISRFIVCSSLGHQYIMVAYVHDANTITATSIKNRPECSLAEAYTML